jgi:hypothetical protein
MSHHDIPASGLFMRIGEFVHSFNTILCTILQLTGLKHQAIIKGLVCRLCFDQHTDHATQTSVVLYVFHSCSSALVHLV